MPYESDKQRRFMHAQHPEIAKRWDREYGTTPTRRKPAPVRAKRGRRKPT